MAYRTHTSPSPYPTPPRQSQQRARNAPARTDTIPTFIESMTQKKLKHVQLCQSHGLVLTQGSGLSQEARGFKGFLAWDSMDHEPPPPPAIEFKKPATEGRRLTRQELEQFKDPRSVYGKIFKVDELMFKVISIAELPRGPEIKLWYEIAEDPVEVTPQELRDMLSRTDCLYYPGN
ncbi:hypothetical protein HYDPIDRAFT_186970 [Hydnomerulius pinastri MD-312]|nr:hypothetical protein HYDPIDRAFT_186970 [Hydnomerulius pinastri MD-312]